MIKTADTAFNTLPDLVMARYCAPRSVASADSVPVIAADVTQPRRQSGLWGGWRGKQPLEFRRPK